MPSQANGAGSRVRLPIVELIAMLVQTPIRRRKISEEVAERLQQMIAEQAFQVGDPLPTEREIMAALGVGRSAVREAIFALTKRGLVEVRNGEKTRVAAPNATLLIGEMSGAARQMLAQPDGVRSFQDARRLFETGVAARAAERGEPDDIARLATALEANRTAIGIQRVFEQTDFLFHRQIAVAAHNPLFLAITEALVAWLLEQRHKTSQGEPQAIAAYEAHERIFSAIRAKDAAAASAAMEDHLVAVERLYWDSAPGTLGA